MITKADVQRWAATMAMAEQLNRQGKVIPPQLAQTVTLLENRAKAELPPDAFRLLAAAAEQELVSARQQITDHHDQQRQALRDEGLRQLTGNDENHHIAALRGQRLETARPLVKDDDVRQATGHLSEGGLDRKQFIQLMDHLEQDPKRIERYPEEHRAGLKAALADWKDGEDLRAHMEQRTLEKYGEPEPDVYEPDASDQRKATIVQAAIDHPSPEPLYDLLDGDHFDQMLQEEDRRGDIARAVASHEEAI